MKLVRRRRREREAIKVWVISSFPVQFFEREREKERERKETSFILCRCEWRHLKNWASDDEAFLFLVVVALKKSL